MKNIKRMKNAWVRKKNDFEVKTGQFIALIKDHSKRDAKRDSSYPQKLMYVYEFILVSAWLAKKLNFLLETL